MWRCHALGEALHKFQQTCWTHFEDNMEFNDMHGERTSMSTDIDSVFTAYDSALLHI